MSNSTGLQTCIRTLLRGWSTLLVKGWVFVLLLPLGASLHTSSCICCRPLPLMTHQCCWTRNNLFCPSTARVSTALYGGQHAQSMYAPCHLSWHIPVASELNHAPQVAQVPRMSQLSHLNLKLRCLIGGWVLHCSNHLGWLDSILGTI
jgi:hypothetical protein